MRRNWRIASYILCCGGAIPYGFFYLMGTAGVVIGMLLANVWLNYAQRDAQWYFDPDVTPQAGGASELRYPILTTVAAGLAVSSAFMMSGIYYQCIVQARRRLRRQAFNQLDAEQRIEDKHFPDYSYDYDSDIEPPAAMKFFLYQYAVKTARVRPHKVWTAADYYCGTVNRRPKGWWRDSCFQRGNEDYRVDSAKQTQCPEEDARNGTGWVKAL